MRRPQVLLAFGVAAALGLGSSCSDDTKSVATTQPLFAAMDTGQVVTPTNEAFVAPAEIEKAEGAFTATLDSATKKLSWRIMYSGLGTPRLPVADIHLGQTQQFGAILVGLCGPCKAGKDSGVVKVTSADVKALLAGTTWVTVITEDYPNGAIRGQIRQGTGVGSAGVTGG